MNSILRFASSRINVKNFTTSTICSTKSFGPEQPKGRGSYLINKWNRALAEAEKLLGYPNILMNGKTLHNEDLFMAMEELRKISGSSHPLRTNLKRLLYDGQNLLQAKGMILLLFAKVIAKTVPHQKTLQEKESKSNYVATLLELTSMAQDIHLGVINIDHVDCDLETRDELDHGNKLSILFADYLLARANLLHKELREPKIVHLLSEASRYFIQSQFYFDQDDQGIPYPSESSKLEDWNKYVFQRRCSLLGNMFKSVLLIYEADDELMDQAHHFGRNLGFAWQSSTELKSFLNKGLNPYSKFSLVSCPVILQLQRDASLMELITPHQRDLDAVDYKRIHEIMDGSPAVEESRDIFYSHVRKMLDFLKQFPDFDEKNALIKIIHALE